MSFHIYLRYKGETTYSYIIRKRAKKQLQKKAKKDKAIMQVYHDVMNDSVD